jgi:hypothetical protein
MRLIKKFTNFSSVNEEFIPKKITKEGRNQSLLELSKTLDTNKKDLLSLLLLTLASFYANVDGVSTLKRYNDETGANLAPTHRTEVRDVYNRLTKGFDVEQFQLLTEVLSLFAVDLGIDSNTIGFNAKVAGQAIARGQENPFYGKGNDPIPGVDSEKELAGSSTPSMARESYKSRR